MTPEQIAEIQGQEQWERFNEEQALEDEIAAAEEEWSFEKNIFKMKQKDNWNHFLKMLEA